MPLSGLVAPYGVRELKVKPLPSGTQVAFPAPITLKFTEKTTSNDLKGGDAVVASMTTIDKVEWEIEAGGIALEVYAAITGRTTVSTGTTPNQTLKMTAKASDVYPYFTLWGKVITDAGDLHIKLFKCKLEEFEGEFKEGEFFVTKCSGSAIDDVTNGLYEMVRNETATALPAS